MRKSLRQAASAFLVAVVLLALASPAVAAPREEPVQRASFAGQQVVAHVLNWLGQWFGTVGPQATFAPTGDVLDGEAANGGPGATEPADGGGTQDGGAAIDPNG